MADLRAIRSMTPAEKAVWGAAALVIAGLWAFVLTQIRYEREEAVAAAIRRNVNQAIALEHYVNRTLETADIATSEIGRQYADRLARPRRPDAPIERIDNFRAQSLTFRVVNLFNARGEMVATSSLPTPRRLNVFDMPAFQAHLRSAGTQLRVSAPAPSRLLSGEYVFLSRRINDAGGRMIGVAGVQIRPAVLTDFLKNASLRPRDMVSVIGLDGVTRARRTGNIESHGEDLSGKLVMRMQEMNPYGTYLGPSGLDGLVRYFSHRRLPRYELFVTSGVSREDILRPVRSRAFGYMLGGAVVSILAIVAAALFSLDRRWRIAREEEMRSSNVRLSEAQRIARIGDWSFDAARETTIWSTELCALYRRDKGAGPVGPDELAALFGDAGLEKLQALIGRARDTGERQEIELVADLPGGEVSHRHLVAVARFDGNGRFLGVHGTDQDITPRKMLESLQEQVTHLSRLDAMNAIASTLAHELNQPLTAAANYVSGSLRIVKTDEDRPLLTDALTALGAQIRYAGEIIRRVRDGVDKRRPGAVSVPLRQAIEDAIQLVEAAAPELRHTISHQLSPDCDRVVADPVQLQQILVNLIRNGCDACGDRRPRIVITSACRDDRQVEVAVSDNGSGIADRSQDVFSPFTSTKGNGLGLGLAISRTLVETQGGRIWVRETGAAGTVISFTLPAANSDHPLGESASLP